MDDVTGPDLFTSVCALEDQEGACGSDNDDPGLIGCSGVAIILEANTPGALGPDTPVRGFVFTVSVDSATNHVCLGTTGAAVLVFS